MGARMENDQYLHCLSEVDDLFPGASPTLRAMELESRQNNFLSPFDLNGDDDAPSRRKRSISNPGYPRRQSHNPTSPPSQPIHQHRTPPSRPRPTHNLFSPKTSQGGQTRKKPPQSGWEKIQELPNVRFLKRGNQTVILVGTSHFSQKSAKIVKKVIRVSRPDVVMLELCPRRASILNQQPGQLQNLTYGEILESFRKDKSGGLLHLGILMIYKSLIPQLQLEPGSEFRSAVKAANEVDARVVLGDRDQRVTLQRAWESLEWQERIKLVQALGECGGVEVTAEDVEEMKDEDSMGDLITQLAETFPSIRETLLHERDLFMTHSLRQIESDTVVAVVGAAHVEGIEALYLSDDVIDVASISMARDTETAPSLRKKLHKGVLLLFFALMAVFVW
eukprot:CAMPEP_0201514738 /NCGR_PEP_ID=MMETSP0161_2-20130828/6493_1 /ASSEMBLY_ACC=CAM_ASM_000251 /TAXON_ID=180227 /ORGANISM="Neoparamoeba aestuarina, Strain SoJaBio B1-5/56/2" /LENGTH=391 /DNA_ID=CAMNT_0047911371 /DNA_START=212 /DNA_END=1384 /DNA_ORIENTATION=+